MDFAQKPGKWPTFFLTLQSAELCTITQAFPVSGAGLKGEMSVLFSSVTQK